MIGSSKVLNRTAHVGCEGGLFCTGPTWDPRTWPPFLSLSCSAPLVLRERLCCSVPMVIHTPACLMQEQAANQLPRLLRDPPFLPM